MTIQVSYMGTKKQVAPHVSEIAATLKEGPFLDLFSGICAIGGEMSQHRQIWCNDAMTFSNLVAKSLFTSNGTPPSSEIISEKILPLYQKNFDQLSKRFRTPLKHEHEALTTGRVGDLRKLKKQIKYVGTSPYLERERNALAENPNAVPYRLFSITFANGYFGLRQCIAIDSIRYAIDHAYRKKAFSRDQYNWCMIALCQTLSKSSTSPGHFAQYIKPKASNKSYYIKQRSIDIWTKWLEQFGNLAPIRERGWRKKNKAYKSDAVKLLDRIKKADRFPSVVYADPPYTSDQYSRYYHLYETVIRYDYPTADGEGRYRPDRFSSDFSLRSKVDAAFESLIRKSAGLGADLIISYPSRGCLHQSTKKIKRLLKDCYREHGIAKSIAHQHSTMGASKGAQKHRVKEIIFFGRKAKKPA